MVTTEFFSRYELPPYDTVFVHDVHQIFWKYRSTLSGLQEIGERFACNGNTEHPVGLGEEKRSI